eukprot:s1168_g5.t1
MFADHQIHYDAPAMLRSLLDHHRNRRGIPTQATAFFLDALGTPWDLAMKTSASRCSALVRFVYARCGAQLAAPATSAAPPPRRLKASDEEGLRRAVQDSWPAIITPETTGALPSRLLQQLPKLQQLRELCGHRQVTVRLPKARFASFPRWLSRHFDGFVDGLAQPAAERRTFGDVRKKMPYEDVDVLDLKDAIDEFCSERAEGPRFYAASVPLARDLPELAEQLSPLREALEEALHLSVGPPVPNAPVMYLGAGEQRTPLHCDPTENITLVLEGAKLFRLFPPHAAPFLKPLGGWFAAASCWLSGVVPAVYCARDAFATLPEGTPEPLDLQLKPGDALYLPCGWWHAVVGSKEPNMAIVFGYAPSETKGARYFGAQPQRPPELMENGATTA